MGAFVPRDLFFFTRPFSKHTPGLCNPRESIFNGEVEEAGRPSLAAVALLRSF